MAARRTASFGVPYDYSGQTHAPAPMPALVRDLAARAAALAGHPFDGCLCNAYETGENAMGFHRDAYDLLVPTSWIAIASFGAARTLVFRRTSGDATHAILLEHGSLLLMDRTTQDHWKHAVPRSPGAGRRVSVTFRLFARDPGA